MKVFSTLHTPSYHVHFVLTIHGRHLPSPADNGVLGSPTMHVVAGGDQQGDRMSPLTEAEFGKTLFSRFRTNQCKTPPRSSRFHILWFFRHKQRTQRCLSDKCTEREVPLFLPHTHTYEIYTHSLTYKQTYVHIHLSFQ